MEVVFTSIWDLIIILWLGIMIGWLFGYWAGRRMTEESGTSFWRTSYMNLRDYQRELDRAGKELENEK